MSAISVEYFDEPIIKPWDEIKPGEVFRTEYGDFGNFVAVVFESNELVEMDWIRTVGKFVVSGNKFEGFAVNHKNSYKYKVIGKEVKNNGND